MEKTSEQFDLIIDSCYNLFIKKMNDYGSAWRILRLSSLTDQIYIKAQRIRNIKSKGKQKVDEGLESEFIGIINYSIMALIQLQKGVADEPDMDVDEVSNLHKHFSKETKELMESKNHDYGEAWREMRISSLTDLIIQKLYRIKQIEDNKGKVLVSEGLEANYFDIINYAVFALIKMS